MWCPSNNKTGVYIYNIISVLTLVRTSFLVELIKVNFFWSPYGNSYIVNIIGIDIINHLYHVEKKTILLLFGPLQHNCVFISLYLS